MRQQESDDKKAALLKEQVFMNPIIKHITACCFVAVIQLAKFQEGLEAEKRARESLDQSKTKDIQVTEQRLQLALDVEQQARKQSDARLAKITDEKTSALFASVRCTRGRPRLSFFFCWTTETSLRRRARARRWCNASKLPLVLTFPNSRSTSPFPVFSLPVLRTPCVRFSALGFQSLRCHNALSGFLSPCCFSLVPAIFPPLRVGSVRVPQESVPACLVLYV